MKLIFWGFVCIQMLIPLYYYTLQEDKFDERFAWRMFSLTSTEHKILTLEGIHHEYDSPILIPKEEYFSWQWAGIIERRGDRYSIRRAREFLCQELSFFEKIRSTFEYFPWEGGVDVFIEETRCHEDIREPKDSRNDQ